MAAGQPARVTTMTITAQKRSELIETYRQGESDTGSPQVQVAVLTERITALTDHLRSHKHDFASRRGLLAMVSRRNRLLKYLARTDRPAYLELIKQLGLRK
jgi:small subunit ribosomal protein S15